MRIKRISKEDLFGIFYVRKPAANVWNSYYETLDALKPLLENKEFNRIVSGFYLNYDYIEELTRISYFVSEANRQEAASIFQNFFTKNEMTEVKCEPPRRKIVAKKYGGEELEERFRHFLSLETQIGLELISAGLLEARSLFATYCLQVRKGRLSARAHFETRFTDSSSTYASLSAEEKERFFGDLERLDWAHMMVNFVLGRELGLDIYGRVVIDGQSLTVPQINEILNAENMGFQVPLDWRP